MPDSSVDRRSWLFAVEFAGRIVVATAAPAVICGFAGRWIDRRMGFSWPIATIAGLVLALAIVYRLMLREGERYRKIFFS